MKWKSVLFAMAIAVGMTMPMVSCSDSNDDPTPPVVNDDDLEEGYFGFQSVLGSNPFTKAVTESAGTAAEQNVRSVRIVLYDAATHIAEYAYELSGTVLHSAIGVNDFLGSGMLQPTDADAPSSYTTPGPTGFIPKALNVKKKAYKLLVLVNPSTELINLTKASREYTDPAGDYTLIASGQSNYDVFYGQTGATVGGNANDLRAFIGGVANHVDNPNDFVMSNFQNFVDVREADILPSKKEAYAGTVNVKVDRAVAKVSFRANFSFVSSNSPGNVDNGTWMLDITNKSSYWMRHMANALNGSIETASTARSDMYAEDSNYDLYSKERYIYNNVTVPGAIAARDLTDHFNYVTTADFATSRAQTIGYHATDWSQTTSEYALENTMPALEQYEDVTTAAILRVTYLPKLTALGATLGTAGYYVWKGYVFTGAELTAIKTYNPAATSNPIYDTFLELRSYLITNAATLEAAGGFNTGFSYSGTSKTVGDIDYNADGINYYRILIRHFDDTQQPVKMAYGRYGIVRNNWYQLTLNSIVGPGSIKVPDPKGPDDDNAYVGVTIEVLPWVVREQIIDID